MHVQCSLFAGIAEFGVLGSFNVDEHHEDVGEHHEDVGEEHVLVFLFDLNLSLEIFSQAVHEPFSCITVILFVAGVMLANDGCVVCLDVVDGEEKMGGEH